MASMVPRVRSNQKKLKTDRKVTVMSSSYARNAIVLGLLSAVGPFAIDMYLPALPSIASDLGASTAATQMTLMAFFLAFGICQIVYGPVSDMVGRKPPPWLYRVVRNAALMTNRADRRRRHHETVAAVRTPVWFVDADLAGLDAAATTAALRALPPTLSEVIVARIWGGLTFEQIGEAVGCSAATAYRGYVAGLSALREKLGVPCPNRPTTTS